MRIFPLFVRYVGGESPALVHLATAAIVVTLGPSIALRDLRGGDETGWLAPVGLLVALVSVYWGTHRTERLRRQVAGLVVQAVLVAGFFKLEPPEAGQALFAAEVGLIAVVARPRLYSCCSKRPPRPLRCGS